MVFKAHSLFYKLSFVYLCKATVIIAVALFSFMLVSCQSDEQLGDSSSRVSSSQKLPKNILQSEQKALDAIKEKHRVRWRKLGDEAARQLLSFKTKQNAGEIDQEHYDLLKKQMDYRYIAIDGNIIRHEMDLELIRHAAEVAAPVRKELARIIKSRTKLSFKVSAYLNETLMVDFEDRLEKTIKRDEEAIAFWKAEREKWQAGWDAAKYDYKAPKRPRGVFLFDFDTDKKGEKVFGKWAESLKKMFESQIPAQIKK